MTALLKPRTLCVSRTHSTGQLAPMGRLTSHTGGRNKDICTKVCLSTEYSHLEGGRNEISGAYTPVYSMCGSETHFAAFNRCINSLEIRLDWRRRLELQEMIKFSLSRTLHWSAGFRICASHRPAPTRLWDNKDLSAPRSVWRLLLSRGLKGSKPPIDATTVKTTYQSPNHPAKMPSSSGYNHKQVLTGGLTPRFNAM